MSSRKSSIIIILVFTAIILLAGIFYWLAKEPFKEIIYSNQPAVNQPSKLPESENNIQATSTPIVIKGEISRGNQNKKQIIFTFDMGAGISSAQKILETAKNHNLKLTFFSTGQFAQKNPDLIRQIAAWGHEIFNHTYSHPHLPQLTDEQIKEELDRAEETISALTGTTTKPFFRPPYGDRTAHVLEIAKQNGYQSVYWTTDALDWEKGKTADEVKQRIYSNLKNGAIILMHVGDDITGSILDEIFTYLENQGYKIVSLADGIK